PADDGGRHRHHFQRRLPGIAAAPGRGRDPGLPGDRALPRREDRPADLHAPDGVERLCRDDRIAAPTVRSLGFLASGAVSEPLPGLLVTGCLVLSVMLTFQSAFTLYIMLYIWDQPDGQEGGQAPSEFLPPRISFTVMLPCRHEEE